MEFGGDAILLVSQGSWRPQVVGLVTEVFKSTAEMVRINPTFHVAWVRISEGLATQCQVKSPRWICIRSITRNIHFWIHRVKVWSFHFAIRFQINYQAIKGWMSCPLFICPKSDKRLDCTSIGRGEGQVWVIDLNIVPCSRTKARKKVFFWWEVFEWKYSLVEIK